jgi:hypothetical protein
MINMTEVSRRLLENQGRSLEEVWLANYEMSEANKEFRRARIRAIIRNAARWTRLVSRSAAPAAFEPTAGMLPVDAIVGVVDEQGRRTAYVPMLRRRMAEAWRRAYRETDHEAHLPLSVVAEADGCYLAGGASALLCLELMRARGRRLVLVKSTSVHELVSEECPENEDCCGAA